MKFLFFILFAFPINSYAQQNTASTEEIIELPIELVPGYSPFETIRSFSIHTWEQQAVDNPWKKTALEIKGLPQHWVEAIKHEIFFDINQFAYQNYKSGKIDEEHLNMLIKEWNIDLYKRAYSDQPIQCFAYLIMGKNKEGEIRYMIDTDNDLDFNDEQEKIPVHFDSTNRSLIPNLAEEAEKITYERIINGQVEKTEIPVLVMQLKEDWLMTNFPQHAKTQFKNKDIRICSNNFTSTAYDNSSIAIMNSDEPAIINEGEVFTLEGLQYKNLGVNISSKVLKLQRIEKETDLYLPQVGYQAPLFSGEEFTSGEPLELEGFSGKFLYVEFWGSWCMPCIKDLPHLKQAYNQLDSSKVSFLGIANDNNVQRLRKLLEKQEINWPQVLVQNTDSIIAEYSITGYPTSFLIDPKGKIIAKDLRGESLASNILRYMSDWHESNKK